jgi:hypothetical protein
MVEEHLAEHRDVRAPLRAIVEHVVQVEPGQQPIRCTPPSGDDLEMQLRVGDTMHSAMWCGVTP